MRVTRSGARPLILNLTEQWRLVGEGAFSTLKDRQSLVSRLNAQVTAVNGFFKCIPDLQNASEYVVKVALARNAKRIVVSDDPILSEFRDTIVRGGLIEVTSPITLSREDFFGALKDAEIGVSLVDLAAAETGTLFISTSDESNRLVTALPEVHVAIVPRSKLVPSLAEAESYLSQEIRNRRAVTVSLISSSSRTSDIGDMVILGVHGPKELHVLLLG